MPLAAVRRMFTRTRPRPAPPVEVATWSAPAETAIEESPDCTDRLWPRGFLLTAAEHRPPLDHWRQVRLGRRHCSYDPRSPIATASASGAWVALLGTAIDLDTWADDGEAVAAALLRARLAGREAMLDRIDALSGRFVVIDGDERTAAVQTDAAGMRAVFYELGAAEPTVASHAGLVAERIGAGPSAFADPEALRREWKAYALPGRYTTFEGVFMLTPNTELDLDSGEVRRCFPRARQERRSAEAVVEEVLPLLHGQLAALTERTKLEVSLTAGLDSRTTLALTEPFADRLDYFTYDTVGAAPSRARAGVEYDVKIATELTERFGLRHHRIEVHSRTPDEPLASVMARNSPRRSNPGMAAAHRAYPGPRGLHLRSNLYEIGRSYWRAMRTQPKVLKAGHMTSLLTKGNGAPADMVRAFAEYVEATGFDRAQRLYDPLDLFYWEHRSGTWLNAHLTESDIAFDTFILINSRKIYKLLLSAPPADRKSNKVFLELIRRSWPEVLDLPINGKRIDYR